ncbi:DUF6361 family protein [bacterium]|nr:DUF6361 family protein [bacterium]
MSGIGWVDFSSEHRERVKSVIDLLSSPGVIDELGIGVIRDAFSDAMFPGISTIQTRAKYFLTVPRLFKEYEKLPPKKRRRIKLTEFLREEENRCMKMMVSNHATDPQGGIIGESFANKQGEVQRKPSSVYWTGIRQFGLVQTSQSLQGFCDRFANPDRPLLDIIHGSDKLKGDDADAAERVEDAIVGLPYADDWRESLTVYLSKDEAEFLSNQIQAKVPRSLIGQILLDSSVREQFLELPNDWNFTTFADEAVFLTGFPTELQEIILAARDFWQLLYGAHIRYNCLLQERHGTSDGKAEFVELWEEWREGVKSFDWNRWDTGFLWTLVKSEHRRVREHTMRFVENWIDGVRDGSDLTALDDLVRLQEWRNKKSRARLQPTANERVDKWIGIDDLNYRLNVARGIIRDIQDGLREQGVSDA